MKKKIIIIIVVIILVGFIGFIIYNNITIKDKTLYSINVDGNYIGDTLNVNNLNFFDNYNDAISVYDHPYFIKYIVNRNNKVKEAYVGFIKNKEVYFLKGETSKNNSEENTYIYELNKMVLDNAFGISNCHLENEEANEYYWCIDNMYGLGVVINPNGYVSVYDDYSHCSISIEGYSICGE